ncbi:hypothetical protein [Treponema sp. R80B11-R83G3]
MGKCFNCNEATENEDSKLTGDLCVFHPCNGCSDDCGTDCEAFDGDFDCNAWGPRNGGGKWELNTKTEKY